MMIDYATIKQEYKSKGFVLISQFFDPNQITKIRKKVAEADFIDLGCDTYFETIDEKPVLKRVERFHDKFEPLSELLRDAAYIELLQSVLGEPPCLFKDKINFKSSGGSGFDLHIDGHFYWQTEEEGKRFFGWLHYAQSFVNSVIPLEPATKQNGALQVARKSVTAELLGLDWVAITNGLEGQGPFVTQAMSKDIVTETIEMDVGDILLFDWQCIHGSKSNHSVAGRPILYVTYNGQSDGQNEHQYFNDKSLSIATSDAKTLKRSN